MWVILVAGIIVIFDQVSKYAVRLYIERGDNIDVIGEFFKITHVQNDGAAFSALKGQQIILIAVSIISVFVAIIFLWKKRNISPAIRLSVAMILGGGIGNMIDRIAFGFVIDMLSFSIFPPVFNVADMFIVIGCILLMATILFEDKFKKDK